MFSVVRWSGLGAALLALLAFISAAGRAETVTGIVTDEAGKPVAGAAVHLTRMASLTDFRYEPAGDLTTDAAGRFSADVEPSRRPGKDSAGKPFPPFFGWATVSAPGLAASQRQLKAGENAFTLKKETMVRGKVTDKAGKPVAGAVASVRYTFSPGFRNDGETLQTSLDEKVNALFEAKTGADGAFTIGKLPPGIEGSLELKNPEYAFVEARFKAGVAAPVTLEARPTAVIVGKVVDEQGKPKVGLSVLAISDNVFTSATTGADGAYRVTRLTTGKVVVYLSDPKKECVAVAQRDIAVTEGKTTTLPDFVANEGGLIEGTFVDFDTGAPVPGMMLAANGPNTPVNRTSSFSDAADEKGVCRIRVAPGENAVRVGSSSEDYPKAYETPSQTISVERGKTAAVTFRLRKGVSIEGVVVDEDDKPVAGIHVRLFPDGYNYEFDREPGEPTDAAGKWKQTGIDRDGRPLKLFTDAKYEVVSPQSVTLDPKDLAPKPLVIKVKRIETRTLAGRVVAADGSPLPGVDVSLGAYERTSEGEMKDFISKNLTTDADGRYRLDTLRPNHSTVTPHPSLQGFRYLRGGELTKNAEGFAASDIVMTPLKVAASGKVTDAKGKPIAGARVWCVEGLPEASALADANGKFALKGLPADGPAAITAMKGRSVARLVVTMRGGKADSGGLNALTLIPEPIPAASESAIIARIAGGFQQKAKEGNGWPLRQLLRSVANRDPNAALRLIPDGLKEDDSDHDRFAVLETFAKSGDPAKVAEWGAALIETLKTPNWKLCAQTELAVSLAAKRPELASRFYDDALPFAASTEDPFNVARLMAASALLHRSDGDALLTRLQTMGVDPWNMARVAGTVGRGDPARAEKIIETLAKGENKEMEAYALARLLRAVLPNDPTAAVSLLGRLQAATPSSDYSGGFELARVTRLVIRAVGPTDPATALKLARALPATDGANNLRPSVLAMAASFQTGETAKTLWKECLALVDSVNNRDHAGVASEVACQCRALKAPPEITQQFWQKAVNDVANRPYGPPDEMVYHAGFFDPAYARMLAERKYDNAVNHPPASRYAHEAAMTGYSLCSSDPEYAVALIERAPTESDYPKGKDDSPQINARLLLAQTLLLTPPQRLTVIRYDYSSEFWETD